MLRRRLAECFAAKVSHPGRPLRPEHSALLGVLQVMLRSEAKLHNLKGSQSQERHYPSSTSHERYPLENRTSDYDYSLTHT